MVQKMATSKKGGPRNFKKSAVEIADLVSIFEEYKLKHGSSHCFDFHSYHNKPSTNAIVALDLLRMKPLLMDLLTVAPHADLTYKPVQHAFEIMLKKDNGVYEVLSKNCKSPSYGNVSSDLANSILCAFAHTRRLRDPIRWQQATAKLSETLVRDLQALRDAPATKPSGTADDPVAEMPCTQDMLADADAEMAEGEDAEAQVSDPDSLLNEALKTEPLPTKKKIIEKLVESKKKPAALPILEEKKKFVKATKVIVMKKSVPSKHTVKKKPAASGFECAAFGRLYTTFATKQSYACVLQNGKKVLLVAISERMSPNHAQILELLMEWLQGSNGDVTKEDVLAKRSALLHDAEV